MALLLGCIHFYIWKHGFSASLCTKQSFYSRSASRTRVSPAGYQSVTVCWLQQPPSVFTVGRPVQWLYRHVGGQIHPSVVQLRRYNTGWVKKTRTILCAL